MGKIRDLTNQKFGRLLVIEQAGRSNNNKIMWKVRCDCGIEKIVRGGDLTSGKTLSCGCLGREHRRQGYDKFIQSKKEHPGYREDLTGQKFGRLLVLQFDEETTCVKREQLTGQYAYWLCQCECGNTISVQTSSLKNGSTQSCGCLAKEKASCLMKSIQPLGAASRRLDLTGQKFGKLTAIEPSEEKTNAGRLKWLCQCECGNKISVLTHLLTSKQVQSCGCIGNSIGEDIIRSILLSNNIPFRQEVKFIDLKDQAQLRFDFGLLDNDGKIVKLIEYDGRQHFDDSSIWYNDINIKHDEMKNAYCKLKNIPLLRIPYTKLDEITLDYLLFASTEL